MTLSEYIQQIGAAEFAKRFGVAKSTAFAYQNGDRRPRPELAQRIVSESPVDWPGVYAGRDQGASH